MQVGVVRLVAVAACVVWLAGCESTSQMSDSTGSIGAGAVIPGEPRTYALQLRYMF